MEDRRAVPTEGAKQVPVMDAQVYCPPPAAREPTYSPVCPIGQAAIGAVDIGDQDLRHRLPEEILGRLGPDPVTGHDDHEGGQLAGGVKLVHQLVRPQTIPLVLIVTLPMDQVQDGIAAFRFFIVARRQVNQKFQRLAQ